MATIDSSNSFPLRDAFESVGELTEFLSLQDLMQRVARVNHDLRGWVYDTVCSRISGGFLSKFALGLAIPENRAEQARFIQTVWSRIGSEVYKKELPIWEYPIKHAASLSVSQVISDTNQVEADRNLEKTLNRIMKQISPLPGVGNAAYPAYQALLRGRCADTLSDRAAAIRNWLKSEAAQELLETNVIKLDLSGLKLTSLPPEILQHLKGLIDLDLSGNPEITKLPESFEHSQLMQLNLQGTQVKSLPANLILPNLVFLTLNASPAPQIPDSVTVPNLRHLFLIQRAGEPNVGAIELPKGLAKRAENGELHVILLPERKT